MGVYRHNVVVAVKPPYKHDWWMRAKRLAQRARRRFGKKLVRPRCTRCGAHHKKLVRATDMFSPWIWPTGCAQCANKVASISIGMAGVTTEDATQAMRQMSLFAVKPPKILRAPYGRWPPK